MELFLIEVIIITFFLLIIPANRIYAYLKKKSLEPAKNEISNTIIFCLRRKNLEAPDLKKYRGTNLLLSVLEAFEKRLAEKDWEILKSNITKEYLLPYARKKATSYSWVKRNFAARCFDLYPLKEDEKTIISLAEDPVFLVRGIASLALIKLADEEGILQLIKQMSKEKGYAYFYYRDLIMNGSKEVFIHVKKIAETNQEPMIHRTALELLTNKSLVVVPDYIKNDLNSSDPHTRLAAIKIIAHNPQKDSVETLIKCLEDKDSEVRREAIYGLHFFPGEIVFSKLGEMLKDPIWLVRLRAAETLKKMGQPGKEVLENQTANKDRKAFEVAQTVLKYDW